MNQCSRYAANSKTPPGFKLKFGNTSGLNGLGESLPLYAHQSQQASKEEKLGQKKTLISFRTQNKLNSNQLTKKKKKKETEKKKNTH